MIFFILYYDPTMLLRHFASDNDDVYLNIRTYIRVLYMHICVYMCVHTYIHIYMCAYIYIYDLASTK